MTNEIHNMADFLPSSRIVPASRRHVLLTWLGIFVTIVVGLPAIYLSVREKQPEISYELIGEFNVLDIHQPVQDLEIRYRGEDIHAQRKNIRILKLRVQNTGETHIRSTDFDPELPWGVEVLNGTVVDEPKIIEASSDYLKENLSVRKSTNGEIVFSKVVFEKGKQFVLELQVLHSVDDDPSLDVLGKITGIDSSAIIKPDLVAGRLPVLQAVFYGSAQVQIIRVCLFALITLVSLFVILFVAVKVSESVEAYKGNRVYADLIGYLMPTIQNKSSEDVDLYISLFVFSRGDRSVLDHFREDLHDPEIQEAVVSHVTGEKPLPDDGNSILYNLLAGEWDSLDSTDDAFDVYNQMLLAVSRILVVMEQKDIPSRLNKGLKSRLIRRHILSKHRSEPLSFSFEELMGDSGAGSE